MAYFECSDRLTNRAGNTPTEADVLRTGRILTFAANRDPDGAGLLVCFDGLHSNCLRLPSGHSGQLPKRIERGERDEFEAHQVRPAERQFLEHVVSGSRIGDVQDEGDAVSILKREPLIDLAIQI